VILLVDGLLPRPVTERFLREIIAACENLAVCLKSGFLESSPIIKKTALVAASGLFSVNLSDHGGGKKSQGLTLP
jgi:hypothetical protein